MKNVLALLRRGHPADASLSAVVDGTADGQERSRVEAHAAGCLRCRARIDQYRAVRAMLAALPVEDAPRSLRLATAPVRAPRLAPAPVRRPSGLALRAMPALAVAAIVAFAALVGVDLLRAGGNASPDRQVAALRAGSPLPATGGGQEKSRAPQPSTPGAPEPAQADGTAATPESGLAYDAASGTPAAPAPAVPRSAGTSGTPPASTPLDSGQTAGGPTPASSRDETEQPASSGGIRAIRWAEASAAAVALLSGIAGVVLWARREEER